MYDQILRTPDLVMISMEGDEYTARPASETVSVKDIQVTTALKPDGLHVMLTALTTPVRILRLRWKTQLPTDVRILGDAWERTYGDAGWSSMVPYRAMPWYFLIQNGENIAGYGVKVRAGAMCFWQADPAGITLWMDVRSGGDGVILGGRTLEAAVVVNETYHDISAFEAARKFCSEMCTDPRFPDEPVYGSNNWYYAYGISSEEEILKDTDYLVRLTEGLVNRPFIKASRPASGSVPFSIPARIFLMNGGSPPALWTLPIPACSAECAKTSPACANGVLASSNTTSPPLTASESGDL